MILVGLSWGLVGLRIVVYGFGCCRVCFVVLVVWLVVYVGWILWFSDLIAVVLSGWLLWWWVLARDMVVCGSWRVCCWFDLLLDFVVL